jgi:hypothetical protein
MSKRVDIHVGTIEDTGRRFVSAWHRLENGEKVRETFTGNLRLRSRRWRSGCSVITSACTRMSKR